MFIYVQLISETRKHLHVRITEWSYNNDGELIGVVAGNKVFGEEMEKDKWGLRPVPKIEIYQRHDLW